MEGSTFTISNLGMFGINNLLQLSTNLIQQFYLLEQLLKNQLLKMVKLLLEIQ